MLHFRRMLGAVLALTVLGAACQSTVTVSEAEAERAIADGATNAADPSQERDTAADPDGDGADPGADGGAGSDAGEQAPPTGQDTEPDSAPEATGESASSPRALTAADIDCAVPSADGPTALNDQGIEMLERHIDGGGEVPSYALVVDVAPVTGELTGAMRAVIPAQDRTIDFRVFAGMEAFESGLRVENVTVDGQPVDAVLDRALLSVPATPDGDTDTVVELDFGFAIDQMAANTDLMGAFSGESLQPDQVGLLGRTESGMQLGHWFPVWLPQGTRTDPDPSGFGDIGAFPAANICATITVPTDYQVVTGGSRVETNGPTVVEAGAGLRDFSMLISNDLALTAQFVDGVEVRVWGPAGDAASLQTVLGYATASLEVLNDAFGPYPWREVEIISAPLGAGVGGMEWPGAVWIEESMFAGGLPGMGDLGPLFEDDGFGELLGDIGGPALTTALEWTVAHELGHEWWHATVGNDSIESPAVDEPLAQFSACLAMEVIHPDNWQAICEAQTIDQYAQARALGVPDTIAEQPTDRFESSLQYGAVVYGKAPGFYFEAAELLGRDELVASLRSFVEQNSFALVSTNALRDHLVDEAGADGPAIGDMWDRWFREARGDEDIDVSGALGALGGLEGFDLEGLDVEGLFGEGFDIEQFLGEDFDLENLDLEGLDLEGLEGLDLEGLFGEDFDLESLEGFEELFGGDGAALFDGLLEDLQENSGTGDD